MSKKLFIIGLGNISEEIAYYWRTDEPNREIETIEPEALTEVLRSREDASQCFSFFVALDQDLQNFKRMDCLNQLLQQGVRTESFVSRLAVVPPNMKIGFNSYIGSNTVVEPFCQIGYNTFIGTHCYIDAHSSLQHSTWVGKHVSIGYNVKIGNNCVIEDNIVVKNNVRIGAFVCIEQQMKVQEDISDRTFILNGFQNPLRVMKYNNSSIPSTTAATTMSAMSQSD